jgi:hypothetical protein
MFEAGSFVMTVRGKGRVRWSDIDRTSVETKDGQFTYPTDKLTAWTKPETNPESVKEKKRRLNKEMFDRLLKSEDAKELAEQLFKYSTVSPLSFHEGTEERAKKLCEIYDFSLDFLRTYGLAKEDVSGTRKGAKGKAYAPKCTITLSRDNYETIDSLLLERVKNNTGATVNPRISTSIVTLDSAPFWFYYIKMGIDKSVFCRLQ